MTTVSAHTSARVAAAAKLLDVRRTLTELRSSIVFEVADVKRLDTMADECGRLINEIMGPGVLS